MAEVVRNTARRNRFRRIIAREGDCINPGVAEPPCHICGNDIDYSLPSSDLMSFQIDHVTPLALGGTDTLDNCAASHRGCNREKSDTPLDLMGVTFVTMRSWRP